MAKWHLVRDSVGLLPLRTRKRQNVSDAAAERSRVAETRACGIVRSVPMPQNEGGDSEEGCHEGPACSPSMDVVQERGVPPTCWGASTA